MLEERNFEYEKKETYSQEDVTDLLDQNKNFVAGGFKGFIAPEDLETEAAKVAEAKKTKEAEDKAATDARTALVNSLIPSEVSESKFKTNLVTLAKIDENDDKDAIAKKLADTLKENPHLKQTKEYLAKKVIGKETLSDEERNKKQIKEAKFNLV